MTDFNIPVLKTHPDVAKIQEEALKELEEEEFADAVKAMKAKLKKKKTWRQLLFPFRIKIERI